LVVVLFLISIIFSTSFGFSFFNSNKSWLFT
jgi:hypothetical protein